MTGAQPGAAERPRRIVRVIARLNIGGPAIQAITLTRRLEGLGYRTTLVRGVEGRDEGSMDHLADELGVRPILVPSLRRDPGWHDLAALWSLVRIIRRERPDIVHTHAAKGGTLGRVATVLAFPARRWRPVVIHTYHGHSLSGYFSARTTAVYRAIEQVLARVTNRLIAVSDEVRDELVAMRVAPAEQFEVVPLGFDLTPFTVTGPPRERRRAALRAELGILEDQWVVTLVARLVPIKRVDRFLEMAASVADLPGIRFLIVGDGELREGLRQSAAALALGDQLLWAGFRHDMPDVLFASDVAVQTSDNEGTPVSLIEAQAAGIPVVSTRVGGAPTVVKDGITGLLTSPETTQELIEAVRLLHKDRALADSLGCEGRRHARGRFGLDRLVGDIAELYQRTWATASVRFNGRRQPPHVQAPDGQGG